MQEDNQCSWHIFLLSPHEKVCLYSRAAGVGAAHSCDINQLILGFTAEYFTWFYCTHSNHLVVTSVHWSSLLYFFCFYFTFIMLSKYRNQQMPVSLFKQFPPKNFSLTACHSSVTKISCDYTNHMVLWVVL